MRLKGLQVLNKHSEISAIKHSSLKVSTRSMVIQALHVGLPKLGETAIKVVFIVGKKSGKAVVRNRIKRRLRAALVLLVTESVPSCGLNYIVVGRTKAFYLCFSHIKNDMMYCFKKLNSQLLHEDRRLPD